MVGWSMALGTLGTLGTLGAPAPLSDVAGRSALLTAPR
jgi:hypothetical protein